MLTCIKQFIWYELVVAALPLTELKWKTKHFE